MIYLLFYLFIDLQVLSIYLSIQLSIDLTYSSSSSLSICLLSIDYAFIYWEGSPPLFKHFRCILRIWSPKNNGGISTELRYFHRGVLEPPAGILHNSQSLPIGWYISVTRQFQILSNKGFLFQQKTTSTCFLHVPIFTVLESHFHSWFPNRRLVKTSHQPQNFTSASDSPQ